MASPASSANLPAPGPPSPPPPPERPRRPRRDFRHHPIVAQARALSRQYGLWALGHFLEEAAASLWRSRATSAFAIGIIGLSLATAGAFLLVAENLGGLVQRLASLEVSVLLADAATPDELEAIRGTIAGWPGVIDIRYSSKDEALDLFRRLNPGLAAVPETLGENPFPASFEVTLTREARSAEALERFAKTVEATPGVDAVSRDLAIAERIRTASFLARVVGGALGAVLLLSSLFIVSNVVKLTVYARKDEVQLLHVVGATPAYVRGTFVTEGILQGLLGSALALALLYLAYRLTRSYLRAASLPLLASLATDYLSGSSMLLIVVAGTVLGAIGSLVPLTRLGGARI